VPCGFNSEGLPAALQIVTKWHQDALCLRLAAAFEAAAPWAEKVPAL
jgi:aspartyl-tRNA(Asn)/glutamyl-tRNA(Gln) amidotransferase subunit A